MAAPAAPLDPNILADIARNMLRMEGGPKRGDDKAFRGMFGAPMTVIALLWNRIQLQPPVLRKGAHPKHILWALMFLKVYAASSVLRCLCGWPSESNHREWVWYFIERIAGLRVEVIDLGNRFDGYDGTTLNIIRDPVMINRASKRRIPAFVTLCSSPKKIVVADDLIPLF